MGEIYQKKGDNAAALEQYQAGLAELDGKEKSPEAARILTDIGYIYYLDGKYPEAIQMHTQASEAVEETEHYYVQALIYKNLGNVMYEHADFDRTIEYWEKSRESIYFGNYWLTSVGGAFSESVDEYRESKQRYEHLSRDCIYIKRDKEGKRSNYRQAFLQRFLPNIG